MKYEQLIDVNVRHIFMSSYALFMSICNILISHVDLIMLHVDYIMMHVNINVLHVDINKSHVNIPVIISCVHIIDVVCKGQTYATIYLNSFSVIEIHTCILVINRFYTGAQNKICWPKFCALSEKTQMNLLKFQNIM